MKKIGLLIILLFLCGCATPGLISCDFRKSLVTKKSWPAETVKDFVDGKTTIGMTKEQVFWLNGSPLHWTRYPTKDGIFESWFYAGSTSSYLLPVGDCTDLLTSFDFKDDRLIGYSGNGKYFSANQTEDVRSFSK